MEGELSLHQSFSWQRDRGYGAPHKQGDPPKPFPALPWGSKTFSKAGGEGWELSWAHGQL